MMRQKGKKTANTAALPARPTEVEGVVWADTAAVTPLAWLLPGLLPAGAIALIEGRKGTGKSSVAAAWAAAISGGPIPPGWVGPRNRRVLWYCAEEDWQSMSLPRLLGAGCSADRVGCLALRDIQHKIRPPSLPRDAQTIGDLLMSAEIALLIIDGYSSVLGQGLSTSQDQQVRQAWEPMVPALAAARCSCIVTRHLRKGTSGDVTEHGSGSGAIMHIARVTHRCDRHPTESGAYTLSTVARSFGQPAPTQAYRLVPTTRDTVRVDWLGDSPLDAESIAEGRGSEAERDEWQDADRLLASAIGSDWIVSGVLISEAERAGISSRMLRRAKARLGVQSRRVAYGGDGHWEWGPPAAGWPAGLISDVPSAPPPPPRGAPMGAENAKNRKKPERRSKALKALPVAGGAPPTPIGAPQETTDDSSASA